MATLPFSGKDNSPLIDFYRKRRKRACKSRADRGNNLITDADDDDGHDLGKELELNYRIFVNSSLSDYSKKKRKKKIEETIPECGSADHYERLNVIDRGAYGVVYRARDTRTGEIVAMKHGLSLTEIRILTSLPRHRRIVELKEVAADGNSSGGVHVVMEYVEYDLHRYMKVKDALTIADIKSLMKQLLEGVEFLHRNMVMHRDLKPSNILVSSHGEVKICDFGLSRRFKVAETVSYSSHVGSLQYRAPELLLGARAYSSEVDMWSVGCIMGELLLKRVLFRGQQTRSGQLETIYGIIGSVEDHKFCGDGLLIKEDGLDLLSRLLSCDPTTRITAEDALNHVWFCDFAS